MQQVLREVGFLFLVVKRFQQTTSDRKKFAEFSVAQTLLSKFANLGLSS